MTGWSDRRRPGCGDDRPTVTARGGIPRGRIALGVARRPLLVGPEDLAGRPDPVLRGPRLQRRTHNGPLRVLRGLAGFTVPFAVCLILFTVNLADLKKTGGPLLAGLRDRVRRDHDRGALGRRLLVDPQLARVLGDETWKLAGPFAGTYTGGSLNFFALWDGLEIGNPGPLRGGERGGQPDAVSAVCRVGADPWLARPILPGRGAVGDDRRDR